MYTGWRSLCETPPRPPREEGSLKSIVGSSSSGPPSSVPPAIPEDGTLGLRAWTGRIVAGSPCHLTNEWINLFFLFSKKISIPSVEEIVPAHSMPVVYCPRCNVADIAARFPSNLQPSFVFSQTICLAQASDVRTTLPMGIFKSVNLFKQVKVSFIATLQGLICLFPSKNLYGTL